MKKYKISFCGHYGFKENLLNGQTVKTKIVTDELVTQYGKDGCRFLDTHGKWKALLKLCFSLPLVMMRSKAFVIFPSDNGLKVTLPLISIFRHFTKCSLHYVVIGGYIQDYLKAHRWMGNILKHFDGIYVETQSMMNELKRMDFSNIFVMPNCKNLNIVEDIPVYESDTFRFCTFSRVMKEKGIADAVQAVRMVNERTGKDVCHLDIYGQVDNQQTEWFDEIQMQFPHYVKYGGMVPFENSVEVLRSYYSLLFPTYYECEGFAGTFLDAFASAIPPIASDWRYNAAIVEDGKTGLLFTPKDASGLAAKIEWAIAHKEEWEQMRKNCRLKAYEYLPASVVKTLTDNIESTSNLR